MLNCRGRAMMILQRRNVSDTMGCAEDMPLMHIEAELVVILCWLQTWLLTMRGVVNTFQHFYSQLSQ